MVDVDEAYSGAVIEELGRRGGRMQEMGPAGEGRMRLEYLCPARGLIGYRSQFLTDTRGGDRNSFSSAAVVRMLVSFLDFEGFTTRSLSRE